MFKHITLIAITVIFLTGCSSGIYNSPTSVSTSGIEGYVTEGPTCPGPVPSDGSTECANKPYQATISILDSSGQEVTKFQTDAAGYFKVSIDPGDYTLHPLSANTLPHAFDQTIIVNPGEYTQVTVVYDTGMR